MLTPRQWILVLLPLVVVFWLRFLQGYVRRLKRIDPREAKELQKFETFALLQADMPRRLTVKELADEIQKLKPGQDLQIFPPTPEPLQVLTRNESLKGLALPRNRYFTGNKHPRINYMANNTQSDTPAKLEAPAGQNDLLLWLDFETTNLEPSEGYPLEVCAQLTSLHNVHFLLDEYHDVFPFKRATIFDDVVITMHARSGLIAECAEASGENSGMVHAADVKIANMIHNCRNLGAEGKGPFKGGRVYIAGTSAHFDLRWLKTHMPQTASLLHYRVFDVSAFELMLEAQGMPRRPKSTHVAHRSREDLKWARARYAELWQWCKDRAASEIVELAAQELGISERAEQTATEIGETPRV